MPLTRRTMSTFTESLRRSVAKTFTFQGRDSRADYRRLFLTWYAGFYAWVGLGLLATHASGPFLWLALGVFLLGLVLLLPACLTLWTAQVRRLHDLDSSGWWLLLPVVPLILLFPKGEAQDNSYGPPPAEG